MEEFLQQLLSGDMISLILLVLFGISELLGMIPFFKNNAVFQLIVDILAKLVGDVGKPIVLAIWDKLLIVLGRGGEKEEEEEVAITRLKKKAKKKKKASRK